MYIFCDFRGCWVRTFGLVWCQRVGFLGMDFFNFSGLCQAVIFGDGFSAGDGVLGVDSVGAIG